MYLCFGPFVAEFAASPSQSGEEFASLAAGDDRINDMVGHGRLSLPFQGDATEPCDQWFPACPADVNLEAPAGSMRCRDGCFIFVGHLRHRRAVFGRQCFEHRGQHDPFEPVQSPDVAGEQVVLDDAPVLGSVDTDDVVVGMAQQGVQVRGFAALEVGGTLFFDHR